MAACSVDECKGGVFAVGYCQRHYVAQHTHGDPLTNLRGRPWTPAELRRLELVLDSEPNGLGHAEPGEAAEIALLLERTRAAVVQRLSVLRRDRLRARAA